MRKQEALALLRQITEQGKDPFEVGEAIPFTELPRQSEGGEGEGCQDAHMKQKDLWTEFLAGKMRRCCTLHFCDGTKSTACSGWQTYDPEKPQQAG